MIKTINQNQTYSTYDIFLASCLKHSGYKLLKLDRSNPKKILFYFLYEADIEQAVEDFFNCNFQVDCLSFCNCLKALKNQIYST